MHRTHYNPKNPAGRKRINFIANLENKNILDGFFRKVTK